MFKRLNKITVALIIPSTLLFGASSQLVAAEESLETAIEKIVVTARGRAENIQKIPESITSFNAAQSERAGIKSFRDVADLRLTLSPLLLDGQLLKRLPQKEIPL